MLQIRLLYIGKTKFRWVQTGVQHYQKEIKPFAKFELHEVKVEAVRHIVSAGLKHGRAIGDRVDLRFQRRYRCLLLDHRRVAFGVLGTQRFETVAGLGQFEF